MNQDNNNNNNKFAHVEYQRLSAQEHCQYLSSTLVTFINLCDAETFQKAFKFSDNDYLMQYYAELKAKGLVL